MNSVLLDFIRAAVIAAIPIIGVIWLADRNLKAARIAADALAAKAVVDGETAIKVKVIDGHEAFEQRVAAELARQDAKIESQNTRIESQNVLIETERKQRFALEQELHDSKIVISTMAGQIKELETARESAIQKITLLNDANTRRKHDCEQTISHQHDQIVELSAALARAIRERDELRATLDNINNIGSNG